MGDAAMIKKIIIVSILILSLFSLLLLSSCSSQSKSDYSSFTSDAARQELLDGELKDFLAVNGGNRTSQTKLSGKDDLDGEKEAARYICSKLNEYAGSEVAVIKEFVATTSYGDEFTSQNVVLSISATSPSASNKKMIFGAYYDNSYETVEAVQSNSGLFPFYSANRGASYYITGTKAEGAMESGMSVAILLDLARRICADRDNLKANVDIVFYGLGALSEYGSYKYSQSIALEDILIAFNVSQLGGDNLYYYCDEVSTIHGDYINKIADEGGMGSCISEQKAGTIKYAQTSEALPYLPAPLNNDSATFFDSCNICSITSGAERNPFFFSSKESDSHENISATSSDSYKQLQKYNENYLKQMDIVSSLLTKAAFDEEMVSACEESFLNKPSYVYLSSTLWLNITVGVLISALIFLVAFLTKVIEKRHPFNPMPKNEKREDVFGDGFGGPSDGGQDFSKGDGSGSGEPENPFEDFFKN